MNFLRAVQHATIGYAVKRPTWQQWLLLDAVDGVFRASMTTVDNLPPAIKPGTPLSLDLADYHATDWETL